MGNAASGEAGIENGESHDMGYRVLGVQPGSPAASAGLVSFFDFIVEANGVALEVSCSSSSSGSSISSRSSSSSSSSSTLVVVVVAVVVVRVGLWALQVKSHIVIGEVAVVFKYEVPTCTTTTTTLSSSSSSSSSFLTHPYSSFPPTAVK